MEREDHHVQKGKKLDSKGIILACVGIIIVCIAINVAFALFPPTGRTDDNSAVESSAASDGAVDTYGHDTDGESNGGTDGQGETIQVDPSIVAVPDNLPEGDDPDWLPGRGRKVPHLPDL